MDLIKNYTLFAHGERVSHRCASGDWISRYSLSTVILKNEMDNQTYPFIPEENKKLTKRLSEHGYKTNGKGQRMARQVTKLLKETKTTKRDWSHVVYPTDIGIDVWLTNINYSSFEKVMRGQAVLFRMVEKTKQIEVIRYNDIVQEHKKATIDGVVYFTPMDRKAGGRYHSFNKKDGNKSFVWRLEMTKKENRGWELGKLRKNATLEENTEHNNQIVEAVTQTHDEVAALRKEIEYLKAQLKVA
ncbi:hypothetical protein OPW07_24220 [Vibrio europaeus]|uniref:hypothetical protein n=1 Tax=Vibrio europaeus TaxID=300876 RepID=UPI0018A7B624|nr:hypothetical protein [Vibrio europaeus]MDC5812830.1 hypothetical protein [Vibrio europaeus]QPG37624.1 hypothetical protein IXK98_15055 [Vibrio europaeus]